jgi:hypothetical protein
MAAWDIEAGAETALVIDGGSGTGAELATDMLVVHKHGSASS